MNHRHFNSVKSLPREALFEKAKVEAVPFNKYWPWIEREVSSYYERRKKNFD